MHSTHQSRRAPRVPRTQQFPILGNDIAINQSHQDKIRETESFRKALRTRKDHNNRLKEMLTWISNEYPEYFATGTVELSDDQKQDKDKYHHNEFDFIYHGLNVSIIKAVMSAKKLK